MYLYRYENIENKRQAALVALIGYLQVSNVNLLAATFQGHTHCRFFGYVTLYVLADLESREQKY